MDENYIFQSEMRKAGIFDEWSLFHDPDLKIHNPRALYKQKTFARFLCSRCKRNWHSDMCPIYFLVNLNKRVGQGTVKMRKFRQECSKCTFPIFEEPKISDENLTRVCRNLANYIQRKVYNKVTSGNEFKPLIHYRSDGPHDQQHCEACRSGLCNEGGGEQDNTGMAVIAGLGVTLLAGGLALLFSKN